MISINKEIVSAELVKREEIIERPDILHGSTIKIKPPTVPYSYYMTINFHKVNGVDYPFEIFIDSKNTEKLAEYKAIVIGISAAFREACGKTNRDSMYILKKMKSVPSYDQPYYIKGKRYNGVINHIICEIEDFLNSRYKTVNKDNKEEPKNEALSNARQCSVCGAIAVVRVDGCDKCLECDASKCG
jgi:hypothetical protein